MQLDDDLRFILENDSTKVEELLKRHTDEISTTVFGYENQFSRLQTSKINRNIS